MLNCKRFWLNLNKVIFEIAHYKSSIIIIINMMLTQIAATYVDSGEILGAYALNAQHERYMYHAHKAHAHSNFFLNFLFD